MRRENVTAGRQLAPEQATSATIQKHWKSLKPLVTWALDNAAPS